MTKKRRSKGRENLHLEDLKEPKDGSSVSTLPALPRHGVISTDRLLAVISFAVALALGFVAVIDIYPIFINLTVYGVCLACLIIAGWRWEATVRWRVWRKIAGSILLSILFLSLVFPSVHRQYKREMALNLRFKESAQVTWWFEQRTTLDLGGVNEYLNGLGIATPGQVPAIAIYPFPHSTGFSYYDTPERSYLALTSKDVSDRTVVTAVYINYVLLSQIGLDRNAQMQSPSDPRNKASFIFATYLNSSFWGKRRDSSFNSHSHWADVLWELRSKTGRGFTDSLVASAFQEMKHVMPMLNEVNIQSHGSKGVNANSEQLSSENLYLFQILRFADWDASAGGRNWPMIAEIIRRQGFPGIDAKTQPDLFQPYVDEMERFEESQPVSKH